MKQGEKISTFWSSLNKATKPKDCIIQLKNPGPDPPSYTMRSEKMAEIGREHHKKLLMEGLHPDKDKRNQIITKILNEKIQPDDKLNELGQETLGELVNEEGVALALCESANGSSPGLDGITYKFYKMLQQIKQEDKKKKYKGLDIVWTLTMVYKDIEEFGVNLKTSFTK